MGSGRRNQSGKNATDDYRSLDVRRWQRDGFLTPGRAFSWQWTRNGEAVASIQVRSESDRVVLSYRQRSSGDEWKDENYPVRLDWSPCTYGGQRAWFLCPAAGCGRRVAILYGGGIFACRHCYRLAYPSQRESADDRALRQAQNIRKRLGGTANMMEPFPPKPKGMRWRTYERLADQERGHTQVSLAGIVRRFGLKIEG
jgi:hypothetical protein